MNMEIKIIQIQDIRYRMLELAQSNWRKWKSLQTHRDLTELGTLLQLDVLRPSSGLQFWFALMRAKCSHFVDLGICQR